MSTDTIRHSYTQNAWEGNKYDRNLSLKEIAATLRKELKQAFPQCVFSVVKKSYSMGQSLTVALMEAPTTPFEVWEPSEQGEHQARFAQSTANGYAQLNHYQLIRPGWEDERICNGVKLTPEAWTMLRTVVQMVDAYNFDDSDAQIDYFHSNFHFNLAIGKWNHPYQVRSA